MATFPLRQRPAESYRQRPRSFGSPRDKGGRKHAGCDLYAQAGADVLAVEDGVVLLGPYRFYDGVYALEVQHPSGVVRYGEIAPAPAIAAGTPVREGQVLGRVGKMRTIPRSMLHFELYSGSGRGPLTDLKKPPYLRRADLTDPSDFLDHCHDGTSVSPNPT